MDEEKRDSTLDVAPLVHIMQVQFTEPIYRNGAHEHGESVQFALMCAPVILVFPPIKEPPDICEWHTVGPLGCFNFIREAGVV